jgi:hypothetical protein
VGRPNPEDLSGNLIVQLGVATEELNRNWYERNSQCSVTDVQRWVQHPVHRYLAATLDGFVNALDAVFEAKFMLPWSFSEEAAPPWRPPASSDDDSRPLVRGVAVIGMAGVPDRRDGGAAPDGSGAHLRAAVRVIHLGWNRGRGRSRCAGLWRARHSGFETRSQYSNVAEAGG